LGSFTLAPHFADFVVHNIGRTKNEVAYIYLAGGLMTLVTLPLVGRWSDRYGKRLMFRIMAGCTLVTILVLSNLPPSGLPLVLFVTTLYMIFTSGRFVPAMALITSSAVARYRGSFMSINAALQQTAMGLASVIAGAVVAKSPTGNITGYSTAGIIGASATGLSILLAGRLRVAQEIVESSRAVDSPEASPVLAGASATESAN
jgi:predicted MFS family arabinose efflux permease